MAPPKDGNGNGLTTWMLKTVVGFLLAFLMAWAGFLHAQIGDLRGEDKAIHKRIGETKDQIMARVSRIEPALAALKADVETIKGRLESMDRKLDRALVGRGGRNR